VISFPAKQYAFKCSFSQATTIIKLFISFS
jgi:hypothetical protein